MADYTEELKQLTKKYVRAYMEHDQAGKIATKELKPFKARLERQKYEIDQVFGQKGWSCVKDPISGLFVTRVRISTPKPLTKELMEEIRRRVASLQEARANTWTSVKDAIKEVIDLIHGFRLQEKFTISVKKKPPTTTTKIIHLEKQGMGQYNTWLHAFVASFGSLKQKQSDITTKKKVLKKRYEDIETQVTSIYKRHNYVSIPIKFERKISPEFQDVVIMTGSKYLSQKLPRKTKRYLEYVPKPKRNTVIKKFSPGKKEVTKYLTHLSKAVKLQDLNVEQLVVRMFEDLQERAKRANEEKLRKALANPEFRLKVSMKKTVSKKRRPATYAHVDPKRVRT